MSLISVVRIRELFGVAEMAAVATILLTATGVFAQGTQDLTVDDLDLSLNSNIQPTITIKNKENHIAEEFRVNNRLYMIKITPNVGAPYYLVDPDGDGTMGWRRNSPGMETTVPQWVLLSW